MGFTKNKKTEIKREIRKFFTEVYYLGSTINKIIIKRDYVYVYLKRDINYFEIQKEILNNIEWLSIDSSYPEVKVRVGLDKTISKCLGLSEVRVILFMPKT